MSSSLRMNRVFGRLTLFLLGYGAIDPKIVSASFETDFQGETALRLHRYRSTESDQVCAGDIILANHSSYIDLIYLRMMYGAQFTRISAFPPHKFLPSSFWECLFYQDSGESEASLSRRAPINLSDAQRPIVIFPEGTRTNGRALIKFVADLTSLPPNQRIFVLSLRHDNFGERSVSPTFPIYTFSRLIKHVWAMFCQWNNMLGVKVLPPTSFYKTNFPTPGDARFKPALEDLMAAATPHVRPTKFNMVDKLAFIRAYLWRGKGSKE